MSEDLVKETIDMIRRAKIQKPRDDQSVEACHWSKTGWAIVDKDGYCTCRPAMAPSLSRPTREAPHE